MLSSGSAQASKWTDVEKQIDADVVSAHVCRAEPKSCTPEQIKFNTLVDFVRDDEGRSQIGRLNRLVNTTIKYENDPLDLWQSPLMTLNLGTGDCEDVAILKYALFKELKIEAKVSIGYVLKYMSAHAITIVKFENEWIVLDNHILTMPKFSEYARYFRVLNILG